MSFWNLAGKRSTEIAANTRGSALFERKAGNRSARFHLLGPISIYSRRA